MSPGKADPTLVRRHLLALDAALGRLERHAGISRDAYLADQDLQWAIERGLLVAGGLLLLYPDLLQDLLGAALFAAALLSQYYRRT